MTAAPSAAAPVTPERIWQYGWGFGVTRTLATALELDLFTEISKGATTIPALSKAVRAPERGVRMVVEALVSLGLLTRAGSGFALAPDAAQFLVRTSPAFMGELLLFNATGIEPAWRSLTEVVRTGTPVKALDRPQEGIATWHQLVDALFALGFPAAQVLGAELARERPGEALRLLDVAAGSGVWGIGAATANPKVTITIQDLPETLEHARRWVDRMKVADRAAYLPGDLRVVDFGEAAFDVAVLGHICHSEGPVHTQKLLRNVARALKPGGTIAIAEFVPDADRSGPPASLLFAINMLVHTTEGDTFTFPQFREWLEAAGFEAARQLPAPAPSPLILATKKGGPAKRR
jgi:ubiquinone/menaquinone biosynthesis C-methylase UbiE